MLQDRSAPPVVDLVGQSAELVKVSKLRLRVRAFWEVPRPLTEIVGRALVSARSEIDTRKQLVRLSRLGRSWRAPDDLAQQLLCGFVLVQRARAGSDGDGGRGETARVQPLPPVIAFRRRNGLRYRNYRKPWNRERHRETSEKLKHDKSVPQAYSSDNGSLGRQNSREARVGYPAVCLVEPIWVR